MNRKYYNISLKGNAVIILKAFLRGMFEDYGNHVETSGEWEYTHFEILASPEEKLRIEEFVNNNC